MKMRSSIITLTTVLASFVTASPVEVVHERALGTAVPGYQYYGCFRQLAEVRILTEKLLFGMHKLFTFIFRIQDKQSPIGLLY